MHKHNAPSLKQANLKTARMIPGTLPKLYYVISNL